MSAPRVQRSGSDASRLLDQSLRSPRSGILTPASDGSLNRPSSRDAAHAAAAAPCRLLSSSSNPSLKRTSSSSSEAATRAAAPQAQPSSAGRTLNHAGAGPAPMEELLKQPFVLKPYPPNLLAKPTTLQPLMLLPRECLALSSIDLSAPLGGLPASGRFFESCIRILELEGRLGSNVLVARSESSRISYAVERQDNGLYVVCKLGTWVDLNDLSLQATVVCRQRIAASRPPPSTTAVGVFQPPLTTPALYKENKRKRRAIEEIQTLVRKRVRSQSAAIIASAHAAAQLPMPDTGDDSETVAPVESQSRSQPSSWPAAVAAARLSTPSSQAAAEDHAETQQTEDGLFQNIRNQYFEALYRSKGSLAYFPKGSLSRARAAFHLNLDANLDMSNLIEFLKSLVLTTVLIDKKYLVSIPQMLEQMKLQVESSDDGRRQQPKKQPKKSKLGKDGLYAGEADFVRKWWSSTKPELRDDETSVSKEQVRYHISCLRRRETLLQMILVLEILALEAALPADDEADSQLPGLAPVTPAKADSFKKKRNKHNYPVLLEVHADRLCIWESTTLDDVKAMAESQPGEGAARKSDRPLVEFCVDVILPFFAARLPTHCDALNRKLGGPVITKPDPKAHRREKALPKPGTAATVRRGHAKSSSTDAKSLQRVLKDDRMRRSVSRGADALAHLRHATVPAMMGLKRELSDTRSPKDVPSAAPSPSDSGPSRPVGPLLSRSVSFTQYDEVKSQKKARVEAELKDAIMALKKPNRQLAARAISDESEKRLFGGPQFIKKSKAKLASKSAMDQVQVKATPANNRFRDALAGEPDSQLGSLGSRFSLAHAHFGRPQQTAETGTIPAVSSFSYATAAPRTGAGFVVASSPCVASTPAAAAGSRSQLAITGPASGRLLAVPAWRDVVPASSPIQAVGPGSLHSLLTETPIKRSRPRAQPGLDPVLAATPTRSGGRMGPPVTAAASAATVKPVATAEKSIYQRLGWDDDDELA